MSVQSITRGLSKMIDKLDKHRAYQERQIEVNNARKAQLDAANYEAATEASLAENIATNLRNILGK